LLKTAAGAAIAAAARARMVRDFMVAVAGRLDEW